MEGKCKFCGKGFKELNCCNECGYDMVCGKAERLNSRSTEHYLMDMMEKLDEIKVMIENANKS